jgi:hypothetical protein
LLTAFFLLAFFLAAGFFLATFFATFFFATFFFVTFFFATFFLLADFFAARFLLARRLAADFLAIAFLFATFFFFEDFFAAGFLRATAFFRGAFRADAFFLVTLRFFPALFLRADALPLATFFREVLLALRFLLAVFFAGILTSCRFEKNAQLYIACTYMEAQSSRFLKSGFKAPVWRFRGALRRWSDGPRGGIISGSQRHLQSARDHRFMLRITLHYPAISGMGVTSADAT